MKLILDNIRSANNIGSIFRTCDALGVNKIYLCGISATPPNKEILKTALGATETIAWEYVKDTLSLIHQLKTEGNKTLIAIEQSTKSILIGKYEPKQDKEMILVLGNEVEGVQTDVLNLVDCILEIPQVGKKKSLNVAVAAGIASWELMKKSRV